MLLCDDAGIELAPSTDVVTVEVVNVVVVLVDVAAILYNVASYFTPMFTVYSSLQ